MYGTGSDLAECFRRLRERQQWLLSETKFSPTTQLILPTGEHAGKGDYCPDPDLEPLRDAIQDAIFFACRPDIAEARQAVSECTRRLVLASRSKPDTITKEWATGLQSDLNSLWDCYLAGTPAAQAAAAQKPAAGPEVRELREESRTPAEIEAIYLGDGKIKVSGKPYRFTVEAFKTFIETLLDMDNTAVTSELEKQGVANPSQTAKDLLRWKDGLLAPFILTPQRKKGAGYSTTIKDGRKATS